ncbi:acetyl-coenzyme A synthetase N-terminal domain-containing protein [Streptosporangium sp. CA-115845]|uniref:acetyl-coenzyme A synthetase N-terminal domain-containing protein n=1 Tax=Streptosporangium sp. CA-115845 TaxID=3240071 RepID=UPI003D939F36
MATWRQAVTPKAPPAEHRWFPDGELNTCHNALDRHVEAVVSGATSVPSRFVTTRDQAKATFVADKTAWPAAATAAITLAPPAAGTRQNQKYRAPGVPLWAQAVGTERQSAGSAHLQCHSTSAIKRGMAWR